MTRPLRIRFTLLTMVLVHTYLSTGRYHWSDDTTPHTASPVRFLYVNPKFGPVVTLIA